MTIKDIVMYQVSCNPSTVNEIWFALKIYIPTITRHRTYQILKVLEAHDDIGKKIGLPIRQKRLQNTEHGRRWVYYPKDSNDLNRGTNENNN